MHPERMLFTQSEWVPCPRCASDSVSRPMFTWWGGLLGPRIIPEVHCNACGHNYNGKTGGSNSKAIAIYLAVACTGVICLLALIVLTLLRLR